MVVSYEYDLKCVADNGEECFGICDVESKLCEISGLVAARQHEIAMPLEAPGWTRAWYIERP